MFRSTAVVLACFAFPLTVSISAFAQAASPLSVTQQVTVPSNACSGIDLGVNGSLHSFVPSPTDAWHQNIASMPVDPNSDNFMTLAQDLGGGHLHPDFGTQYGIPYNVIDSSEYNPGSVAGGDASQFAIPMQVYAGDSDQTTYPVNSTLVVEGNPGQCPTDGDDRHLIILDRHSCTNYELYQAAQCGGTWSASNGAIFDLLTAEQRPYGMTSADAAGLSVFEGLIRYDEINAGVIAHAIRFTTNQTKNDANDGYFTAPATHAAGSLWGTDDIMGMRIRLKASFDISGFSPTNQIILTAMKQYGMILADNGAKLYFQGTNDPRWDDNDLNNLQSILSSSFEVVKMGPVYDAVTAPTGAAPTIANFVTGTTVYEGTTYEIVRARIYNGSYAFMNGPGVETGSTFRGAIALPIPSTPTTYTLTARNLYGTTQQTITLQ